MNKSRKAGLIVLICLLAAGLYTGHHFINTTVLKIDSKNLQELYLVEKQEYKNNSDTKDRKNIHLAQKALRIKKAEYIAVYTGIPDYAGGIMEIDLRNGSKSVNISPVFSDQKLESMLRSEISLIENSIKSSIKGVDQYLIQKGRLYDFGDWYATTLLYNGSDEFNSDTLRVVLKKEDRVWKLMTSQPQIILSKSLYKEIPEHILNDVNNNQLPKMQFKYTGEE